MLVVLAVLGAAGWGGWKMLLAKKQAERREEAVYQAQLREAQRREAEADAQYKARQEEKRKRDAERERERQAAREKAQRLMELAEGEEYVKPRDKRKTVAERLAEEKKLRAEAKSGIAAARAEAGANARTLGAFAGVTFGEPFPKGAPVRWGPVLDEGADVAARGAAFAVEGPKLAKPLFSLGGKPLVWLTPKTRRPWRIELSRPLGLKGGAKHDAATTNLVVALKKHYQGKLFTLSPFYLGHPGCEFAIPLGVSTAYVGEYGDVLRVRVDREDLKQEAKAESDELRQTAAAAPDVADDVKRILDARGYPQGGTADFSGVRLAKFQPGTPRAFCGVTFGAKADPLTRLVTDRNGVKGFFLDLKRAKCKPFHGFDRGRADVDPHRGGVYAVRLFCEGATETGDDATWYKNLCDALGLRYGAGEAKGAGAFPETVFRAGDVVVSLGPRTAGGFHLDAVNEPLAALAKQAPAPVVDKKSKRARR